MQHLLYLLSCMFGRACKSLNNPEQASAVARDVQQLRLTLEEKLVDIIFKQMGREREMTLWSSADERDALDTALSPKLDKSRDETERLLYEVITLEVRLRARRAYFLACLLYSAHVATRLDVPCVLVSGHLAIWPSGHLAAASDLTLTNRPRQSRRCRKRSSMGPAPSSWRACSRISGETF